MTTEKKDISESPKTRIIYLFYDGIGLGKKDTERNPFTRYAHSYLSVLGGKSSQQSLPENWEIIPTDAHLQMEGLPQSATGQTALWTGLNGAQIMGRHMMGFPGPTLVRYIKEYSIVKQFCEQGYRAALLNAYTQKYVERMEKKPRLRSVSSHIQLASGQSYMSLDDLEEGRALYMDYTHEIMHKLYPELRERFPVQKAHERGRDLAQMSKAYDLVIHEFFLTDKAGHDQSWEMAEWCIQRIEEFLAGLIANLDVNKDLLLISSDHGNMEDLSSKRHSSNPVATFAYGKFAKQAAQRIKSLVDIPRFIYEIMGMKVEFPVLQ